MRFAKWRIKKIRSETTLAYNLNESLKLNKLLTHRLGIARIVTNHISKAKGLTN